MKKNILNLSIIGTTTFSFLSWTQNDDVTKDSNKTSAANLMVFESVDAYENNFTKEYSIIGD